MKSNHGSEVGIKRGAGLGDLGEAVLGGGSQGTFPQQPPPLLATDPTAPYSTLVPHVPPPPKAR